MGSRSDYWLWPERWPRDPAGYVFLLRTFDIIGRAAYGTSWTGAEGAIDASLSLPKEIPGRFPSEEARARAEATYKRRLDAYDRGVPLRARAAQVEAAIAAHCEAGRLLSAWRHVGGGEMIPIPRSHWNTDRLTDRFIMGQMSLREPFSDGFAGEGFGWIFIEQESLNRLLAGAASAPTPVAAPAVAPAANGPVPVEDAKPQGAPEVAEPPKLATGAGAVGRSKKRRRSDHAQKDQEKVAALERLGTFYNTGIRYRELRPTDDFEVVAKYLEGKDAKIAGPAGIYKRQTLLQILSGRNEKANALVSEGHLDAWWQKHEKKGKS